MAVIDVPVDRITGEARQVSVWRMILTAIAAVLYGIGWTARKSLFVVAWCAAAVKVGWQDAEVRRGPAG